MSVVTEAIGWSDNSSSRIVGGVSVGSVYVGRVCLCDKEVGCVLE